MSGHIHTHSMANTNARQGSEFFSPADIRFRTTNNVTMFLRTPSGAQRIWSVGDYVNLEGQALGSAQWLPFTYSIATMG